MNLRCLILVGALGCSQTTELLPGDVSCSFPGPAIHLGGTDDSRCAGVLSARRGQYALCSCGDLVVTGALAVGNTLLPARPPDPSAPPRPPGPPPSPGPLGAVGVDGYLLALGPTLLEGSLIVAGDEGIRLDGGHLSRTTRSGGVIQTLKPMRAVLDVFAVGGMSGPYSVGGTLHVPAGALVAPEVMAALVTREPVTVSPPCQCGAADTVDVRAAVQERATINANASARFVRAFDSQVDSNHVFDWPCGEFHLPEIRTGPQSSLEFRIHGRVGIFVAGDVRLGNNLSVTLDPGSTLDLVVGGSFFTEGRVFGSPMSPAAVRLWVGSTTVSLPDQIQFGALVYAPQAVFSAGVGAIVYGNLFVQTLAVSADVKIRHDPDAALAGQTCGAAPPPAIP
ncbi:MAG: hypothetical protein ABUL67_01425 [Haliangium ochraceum]